MFYLHCCWGHVLALHMKRWRSGAKDGLVCWPLYSVRESLGCCTRIMICTGLWLYLRVIFLERKSRNLRPSESSFSCFMAYGFPQKISYLMGLIYICFPLISLNYFFALAQYWFSKHTMEWKEKGWNTFFICFILSYFTVGLRLCGVFGLIHFFYWLFHKKWVILYKEIFGLVLVSTGFWSSGSHSERPRYGVNLN